MQRRPRLRFVSESGCLLKPPNGWRLGGDGGEADGVRCSRGLGGLAINVFAIRDPNDEYEQLIVGD